MSKIQSISKDYESLVLYKKNSENPFSQKILSKLPLNSASLLGGGAPPPYNTSLARAIVASVNGTNLVLQCFFYTPISGRVLTIGNRGTSTFTLNSLTDVREFVRNASITLSSPLTGITVGDIVSYAIADTVDISSSNFVPDPLPAAYGFVTGANTGEGVITWTVVNLIGSLLTPNIDANFIFAVPLSSDIRQTNVNMLNVTSSTFQTVSLNYELYYQDNQFFYSVDD